MSGNLPGSKRKGNQLNTADKSSTNHDHSSGDCSRSKPNERRLQDINDQLEMAQIRCNYLKDQLDYMKKMYGMNRNRLPYKQRKISNEQRSNGTFEAADVPKENSQFQEASNATQSPRVPVNCQTSNDIDTENSEAAVRTISNILHRITNPANHLSEVRSQLTTPRMKISSEVNAIAPVKTENISIVPELKIESLISIAPKHRGLKKILSKPGKHAIIIKKPARMKKKMGANSKTGLEKKCSLVSKLNSKSTNLVEIYQNEGVKHSYSDESDLKKSREECERASSKDVPPLNIHAINRNSGPEPTKLIYPADLTEQFTSKPPEALRTEVKWVYSKNYKLPTVASRMKQVPKAYMGNVNWKTIPFCAAISTTQSHNIGINIQQVMNVIKNRQPVNGISPTLAHNIGLAAEKLNNKSFSAFVSCINSQISQSASRCPLAKSVLNIRQLRKQAQTIPEGTKEKAVDEDAREAPEAQTVLIIGPSGDMETKAKTVPNWKAGKNVNTGQGSCLAEKVKTLTENSLSSQGKELKKNGYQSNGSQLNAKVQPKELQIHAGTQEENLNAKEENAEGSLSTLPTDFEYANGFEDLSQRSQATESGALIKELGRLEEELDKKEEAITWEMTLYKELLALKQEVKELKEERSRSSQLSREYNQDTEIRYKEYRNPVLLTKLLRQIQHCQMMYKSSLSQE